MKDEYDFSNAERGRFHREGAILAPPVHLDADVLAFLAARGGTWIVPERTRQRAAEEGHRVDRGGRVAVSQFALLQAAGGASEKRSKSPV
jgi:hypothetical protein